MFHQTEASVAPGNTIYEAIWLQSIVNGTMTKLFAFYHEKGKKKEREKEAQRENTRRETIDFAKREGMTRFAEEYNVEEVEESGMTDRYRRNRKESRLCAWIVPLCSCKWTIRWPAAAIPPPAFMSAQLAGKSCRRTRNSASLLHYSGFLSIS